uniref:Histidine decarboxylase n=1 Tax=Sander lucioperca TaxID=283035 RepID=A0A8C9WYC7_SANLU
MQAEEYNRRGKELVDYITQYLGSIRERRVIPDVKPGYMKELLPDTAPTEPEDWETIFQDIEKVIMPGASSPACTELEMNVMDWLCKALGLPSFFLHHHPDSRGGGILQSTVSESTLVALLAARKDKFLQLQAELDQDVDNSALNSRLVAYASDQLCATLGTTGVCAFDNLSELGPHWQIPLSRRFRSLKLWFVMRSFGLKNLQAHIRHVTLSLLILQRLTRSGTMYLIPADIHTKRIIRFTVTSQFTTAEDILKDWSIISKMASTLLAETQPLNNADQPKSGKDEAIEENQDPDSDTRSEERENATSGMDKAQVELWIDKAWNRSRRPMRSLSCSSEPLPYTCIGPLSGYNFETRPSLKDAAGALPSTPSTAGSGPMFKITEMSSNILGKQVLKKLTKFNSVPSFCNQWVQCGPHQLCCPVKVATPKHLSSTCRRMNCMTSSTVANTAPSPTTLETATAPELL